MDVLDGLEIVGYVPYINHPLTEIRFSFPEISETSYLAGHFLPGQSTIFRMSQIRGLREKQMNISYVVCFYSPNPGGEGWMKVKFKYRLKTRGALEAFENEDPTGSTFWSTLGSWAWVIVALSVTAVIAFLVVVLFKRARGRVIRIRMTEESET
jgi:hypothetical protein